MQTNTPSTLYQLAIVILNARYPKTLRFTYLGFCSSKVCEFFFSQIFSS